MLVPGFSFENETLCVLKFFCSPTCLFWPFIHFYENLNHLPFIFIMRKNTTC